MKNLIYATVFLFVASISGGAEQGFEKLLECDFEDGLIPSELRLPSKGVALSGNGGGRALSVSTMDSGASWPESVSIPLAAGDIYKVEFSYRLKKLPSDGEVFASIEGIDASGKRAWFGVCEPEMSSRIGGGGRVAVFGAVPPDAKNACFRIISKGGVDMLLDNIVLSVRPLPEASVWMFSPDVFRGITTPPTSLAFMNPDESAFSLPKEKFFPFIDKFGQYKHRSWRGKIKSDGGLKLCAETELKKLADTPDIPSRDRFGGMLGSSAKFPATGFFSTAKFDGRWYFVTPEGNPFWSIGATSVGRFPPTAIDGREEFFDDVSDSRFVVTPKKSGAPREFDFHSRNLFYKYGEDWKRVFFDRIPLRLKKWGVNTYGAWTEWDLLKRNDTPFTVLLTPAWKYEIKSKRKLHTYWMPCQDWFGEGFEEETLARVKKWFLPLVNSPWCVGVFVGNEYPWQSEVLALPRAVLTCPPDQPAKKVLAEDLKKKYGDIAALNSAWKSDYVDWNDLLSRDNFVPSGKSPDADLLAFEKKFYDRYFSVCRRVLKSVNPNVLFLGCRFAWNNELVVKSAADYCDVVSFNLYRNNVADFSLPKGSRDVPVMVSEFHFGATDRGVFGGGMRFRKTAKLRAEAFREFAVSAAENPSVVGVHWYEWADSPTSGGEGGGNMAIGLVDICDTPEDILVAEFRKFSEQVYDIRFGGQKSIKASEDKTFVF